MEARKASGEGMRPRGAQDLTPVEEKMSEVLAKIAEKNGIESVTAVALAYVMSKAPYVFPIVGGRKVEVCSLWEARPCVVQCH
jgi:aryl-alcohol dehydrogenase-like predicted oxidoreductase